MRVRFYYRPVKNLKLVKKKKIKGGGRKLDKGNQNVIKTSSYKLSTRNVSNMKNIINKAVY